jgi:exonuclease SbcC
MKDKGDIQKFRAQELKNAKSSHLIVVEKLHKFEQLVKKREDKINQANSAEIEKGRIALKLSKLQSDIDRCISDNLQFGKESALLNIKNFEEEISKLKSKFDKDECEQLESEITKLEVQLTEVGRNKDKLNIEYGSLISKKRELVTKEQEQINLQGELNKLRSEFSVYDKLKHYFGKEGIQSIIIENVIDELENYANDTLSKICNESSTVKIRTQKETEKGSWTETFDIEVTAGGRTDEFETFSGGEKFRISFALRLALSKILSKRMGGTLQFLLLDEVSSSLDDKGLEMFISIVKQLGKELKIMVITHDEKLKEMFDNLIIVNKGVDGSRIELVA